MRFLTSMLAPALAVLLAGGAVSPRAEEGMLHEPAGAVLLEVTGQIERTNHRGKAIFDREMLEQLPPAMIETTTVVTDGVRRFDGFYMRDLLELLGAEGKIATATALNDYVIDIPTDDFERFDVIVATHMQGERLEPRDKGPLWIVYPRDRHVELQDLRYDYRWVWQLNSLEIR